MKEIKKNRWLVIITLITLLSCIFVIICYDYFIHSHEEDTAAQGSDLEEIVYKEEAIPSNDEEKTEVVEEEFRDRIEEKERELKLAAIAKGPEDVINEDYSPKVNLSGEELRKYIQKIFLDICRDPDKIDQYHNIFTEESINLFKEIEWYYDNPKEFYDFATSTLYSEGDILINGGISVDSQYAVWEIDLEEGAEGKWAYGADFSYNQENGIIEISENYLWTSYY